MLRTSLLIIALLAALTSRAAVVDQRIQEISVSEFIAKYTDNGVVYHGTGLSNFDGIRSEGVRLMPGGSDGFYTTPQVDYASAHAFGYKSSGGVVLPIRIQTTDLRVAVERQGSEISAVDAGVLGYDILVRPLLDGQIANHTTGTKVIILSLAKINVPSVSEVFDLAIRQAIGKVENNIKAHMQFLALDKLHALEPLRPLPSQLSDAIAEARLRLRPIQRVSISNVCSSAFKQTK